MAATNLRALHRWTIAVTAIGGSLLLLMGTWLHPMSTDPNNATAAFGEYAVCKYWVIIHLLQFGGVILIVWALVSLGQFLIDGTAGALAVLGLATAVASLSAAAALQAVDGVALKAMVDAWAAAPREEKNSLFYAAFAVRQIEIGLAAMTSSLFGVTASLFGIALFRDERFSRWLGVIGVAGGIPLTISAVVMAHQGFSELAMDTNMPSSLVLALWMIAIGVQALRSRADT